jgi:hypothetical protein
MIGKGIHVLLKIDMFDSDYCYQRDLSGNCVLVDGCSPDGVPVPCHGFYNKTRSGSCFK